MHGIKPQRDGGDPGEGTGGDRHEREQQRRRRAIHAQKQQRGECGTQAREAHHLALDQGARGHREHRRSAHQQGCAAALRGRDRGQARGECPPDGLARRLLRIDVGAGGAGLRDQQRTRAIPRAPHPFACARTRPRSESLENRERLAGRIAREQRFDQRALGRGQQVERVSDRRVQPCHREALRCDGRAQQIAVAKEKLPIPFEAGSVAVVDGDEAWVGPELPGELHRQPRARTRIRALERHEDEACGGAGAQLLDQESLGRAGAAG